MERFSAYLGRFLLLVVVAASLLPTLHALTHDASVAEFDNLAEKLDHPSVECEFCDFQFPVSDTPKPAQYDLYIPLKETLYVVSLSDTVLVSSNTLFSLRAPPASVI